MREALASPAVGPGRGPGRATLPGRPADTRSSPVPVVAALPRAQAGARAGVRSVGPQLPRVPGAAPGRAELDGLSGAVPRLRAPVVEGSSAAVRRGARRIAARPRAERPPLVAVRRAAAGLLPATRLPSAELRPVTRLPAAVLPPRGTVRRTAVPAPRRTVPRTVVQLLRGTQRHLVVGCRRVVVPRPVGCPPHAEQPGAASPLEGRHPSVPLTLGRVVRATGAGPRRGHRGVLRSGRSPRAGPLLVPTGLVDEQPGRSVVSAPHPMVGVLATVRDVLPGRALHRVVVLRAAGGPRAAPAGLTRGRGLRGIGRSLCRPSGFRHR